MEDNSDIMPFASPTHHGHEFTNMFKRDDRVDLTGRVVTEYLFDEDGHFAGVTIQEVATGLRANFMPDNLDMVDVIHVPEYIKNSYDHTRLIGFRTTKRCNRSRFIQ